MPDIDRFSLFTEARERLGRAFAAGLATALPEIATVLARAADDASSIVDRRRLGDAAAALRAEGDERVRRAVARLYDLTFRMLEANQTASAQDDPPLLTLMADDELDHQILADEIARAVRERLSTTYDLAMRRVESLTRTASDDAHAPLGATVLAAAALEALRPLTADRATRGPTRAAALEALAPRLAEALADTDAWLEARGIEPVTHEAPAAPMPPELPERREATDAARVLAPEAAPDVAPEASRVVEIAPGSWPGGTAAHAPTIAIEPVPHLERVPVVASAAASPPIEPILADTQAIDPQSSGSHADTSSADASRGDGSQVDASRIDGVQTDGSPIDTSRGDASPTDASPTDASQADVSPTDVSPTDVSPTDVSPAASAPTSSAVTSSAVTDSATTDSATTDSAPTGSAPTGAPQTAASQTEARQSDASPTDSVPIEARPTPVSKPTALQADAAPVVAPPIVTAAADIGGPVAPAPRNRTADALATANDVAEVLGRQPIAPGRPEAAHRHAATLPKPDALEQDAVAFAHHVGATPYTREARQRFFDSLRSRMRALDAAPGQLAALDLISGLFDYVVDDTRMPEAAQPLLWRLQHPAVTLAALDAGYLGDDRRSVRRLVEHLAAISVAYADDVVQGSELYRRLETVVRAVEVVAHAFQARSVVLGDQVSKEYQRAAQGVTQIVAKVAKERSALDATPGRRNRRDYARRPSRDREQAVTRGIERELHDRLDRHDVPESVREFVLGVWLRHLRTAVLRDGEGSSAYRLALQVVDDLLWSLDASGPRPSRSQLATRIPPLIRLLTQGVTDSGAKPEEFRPFLDELFLIHLRKMQKVPRDGGPATGIVPAVVQPSGETPVAAVRPEDEDDEGPLPTLDETLSDDPRPAAPGWAERREATAPRGPSGGVAVGVEAGRDDAVPVGTGSGFDPAPDARSDTRSETGSDTGSDARRDARSDGGADETGVSRISDIPLGSDASDVSGAPSDTRAGSGHGDPPDALPSVVADRPPRSVDAAARRGEADDAFDADRPTSADRPDDGPGLGASLARVFRRGAGDDRSQREPSPGARLGWFRRTSDRPEPPRRGIQRLGDDEDDDLDRDDLGRVDHSDRSDRDDGNDRDDRDDRDDRERRDLRDDRDGRPDPDAATARDVAGDRYARTAANDQAPRTEGEFRRIDLDLREGRAGGPAEDPDRAPGTRTVPEVGPLRGPEPGRAADRPLLTVLSDVDLGDFPADPQRLRMDPDDALEQLSRGDWLEIVGRDGTAQEVKVAWINTRRTVVLLVRRPDRRAMSLRVDELRERFAQRRAAMIR